MNEYLMSVNQIIDGQIENLTSRMTEAQKKVKENVGSSCWHGYYLGVYDSCQDSLIKLYVLLKIIAIKEFMDR